MGNKIFVQVMFKIYDEQRIIDLAIKHYDKISDENREVKLFLNELKNIKNTDYLANWAIIYNVFKVDNFIETLKTFWKDLLEESYELSSPVIGNILIFCQDENSDSVTAVQISRLELNDDIEIKKFSCPFGF